MKRREFCLSTAFFASLLATTLPGCGNSQPTANGAGNAARGTLKMATDANYPPYEFYDTASGSQDPKGFDIDIAHYITGKLGYELQIVSMDFSGVIPALQAKRVDFAMAGITPTEERKQNVDFSDIYYATKDSIVVLKDSGIKTVEDLSGKTLGAKLGTVQEQAAKKLVAAIPNIRVSTLNDQGALIQEMKAGRVNAVAMEDTVAKEYLVNNADLEFFLLPGEYSEAQGNAIAFPKGSALNAEFAPVLNEMKTNGELDKLIQTWFVDYYKQKTPGNG